MMQIEKLEHRNDIHTCARIMFSSEPWITLKRDFEQSLAAIQNPDAEKYMVKIDGQIAGFAIIKMKGSFVGYIQSIVFAETYRGKGLGTEMIKYLEKRIFSETPNVFICTSSFNPRALKLYQRLGYEKVGKLKDYIVKGHSEILLRKTIGPLS